MPFWSPKGGHVYSPLLTRAYAQAASRLGARIEIGVPVVGLIRVADRVLGVRTTAGQRGAAHVVLCAGAVGACAAWLDEMLPVEPVRGRILSVEAPRPTLRSIVWGSEVYLVPKLNGSVVVGATEERVGIRLPDDGLRGGRDARRGPEAGAGARGLYSSGRPGRGSGRTRRTTCR